MLECDLIVMESHAKIDESVVGFSDPTLLAAHTIELEAWRGEIGAELRLETSCQSIANMFPPGTRVRMILEPESSYRAPVG
jgi:hypothetical protein